MKKILLVLEAGDALPSGMVRGLIYKDLFCQKGYTARYISRIPAWMVRAAGNQGFLFSEKKEKSKKSFLKKILEVFYFFLNWRIMRAARGFDVVYLSKVRSAPLIRNLKKKTSARLVYDFGDALWLAGRNSNQFFDVKNFEEILRTVDAVTTDNEQTAAYVRKLNPHVVTIPDYPQMEIFEKQRAKLSPKKDGSKIVIGWIGSPSTAYNLYVVWEALEAIFSKHNHIELRLVGTGADSRLLPQFENVVYTTRSSYSQADMAREVLAMDIGLFPLQDTEVSRVRGILKATIYMSGGCAVVCSPVGQCETFIRDGVNGFLARSKEEWIDKLELLITDHALRRRLAEEGLRTVKENFCLEAYFDQLIQVLEGSSCVRKK